ncbi:MAG: HNH endonuclease signature motif containing protein, partial [Phycicoccus sp.]
LDHATGETVTFGELDPAGREAVSWVEVPDALDPVGGAQEVYGVDPRCSVTAPLDGGCAVSGAEIPGVGWVDANTVAALLKTLPVHVARAVLDADTGTLASLTTNAYTPPTAMREFVHTRDGTCRMWGCTRRATHTDLDHTRPWPAGPTSPSNLVSLCRRHHRMKQDGRWRYTLDPDGDLTWVSTTGTTRHTEPAHRVIQPSGSRAEPTSDATVGSEPPCAPTAPGSTAMAARSIPTGADVPTGAVAASNVPTGAVAEVSTCVAASTPGVDRPPF